jgi:chaperone required for assembly of F1-ATPase
VGNGEIMNKQTENWNNLIDAAKAADSLMTEPVATKLTPQEFEIVKEWFLKRWIRYDNYLELTGLPF